MGNITGATSWKKPENGSTIISSNSIGVPGNSNVAGPPMDKLAAGNIGQIPTMDQGRENGENFGENALQNAGEWVEVIDSTSGRKYYFHSTTKATSWTNPTKRVKTAEMPQTAVDNKLRPDQMVESNKPPVSLQQALQQSQAVEQAKNQQFDQSQQALQQANFDGSSPWREAFDKTTGRKY